MNNYRLKLYIKGISPISQQAVEIMKGVCDYNKIRLAVSGLQENFSSAELVSTLVILSPSPVRHIICADKQNILSYTGLDPV